MQTSFSSLKLLATLPFGIETLIVMYLIHSKAFVGMACGARLGLKRATDVGVVDFPAGSEWPVEPVWD